MASAVKQKPSAKRKASKNEPGFDEASLDKYLVPKYKDKSNTKRKPGKKHHALSQASVLKIQNQQDDIVDHPHTSSPTGTPLSSQEHADQLLPYTPPNHGRSHGRPRIPVLDELTVEIASSGFKKNGMPTNQRAYRCTGKGCPAKFQPRALDRVLIHAKTCMKLTAEMRQLASRHSAQKAPGAIDAEHKLLASGDSSQLSSPSATSTSNTFTPMPIGARHQFNFGPPGRKALHAAIDLAVVKFIAVSRTPPLVIDLPEWKDMFTIQTPSYTPASRTMLIYNHIHSEQERIRLLNLDFLKGQERVSISFDGGSLRSGASLYTVHATPEGGDPILIIGRDSTGISHTGQYIASVVEEVSKLHHIEAGM